MRVVGAVAAQVDPYRFREAARRAARELRSQHDEVARCHRIAASLRAELASHPKQLAAFEDRRPQVAELCGRQAGKTKSAVNRMLDTALTKEGGYSVYVNTSKDECRRVVWEREDEVGLLSVLRHYRVPCEVNHTRMTVRIPAMRSRIQLIGIDDAQEVEKCRGPTYDDFIIDEAQKVPYLKKLAVDAALPGVIKRRGSVVAIGTPDEVCGGLFYDITREDGGALPGWSVHRFTIFDNPGIPHAAEYVEMIKQANGWADDDPTLLREIYGKWVADDRHLVYRLATVPRERRYHDGLPEGHEWRYLVGVDLGFYPDPFAIVVWAYCDELPCLYEVESDDHEALNTEDQARLLQRYVDRYDPEYMVGDAGSGGLKQIIEGDFQQRWGLPIQAAEKQYKESAIEAFNADLVAGRIKLIEDSPLDKQMQVLPWKKKLGKRIEDVHRTGGRFRNDRCDAALYSYRESPFYTSAPKRRPPSPGTTEFDLEEMEAIKARTLEQVEEPESLYDITDDGFEVWG